MVESQQQVSTRQLVDSDAEHGILENLIEASKPALPDSAEFEGLDFLLFSPFRYPPLRHGSRFGARHERALWYGSEQLETALAELAYYRLLFFEGTTADLLPNRIATSAFRVAVRSTSSVDLTRPPFDSYTASICSKNTYADTQRLGVEMRADGIDIVRYSSARDPEQMANVALFTPRAFAVKRPLGPSETWHCTVTEARDVSWMRVEVRAERTYEFQRSRFLVDGSFPSPAI